MKRLLKCGTVHRCCSRQAHTATTATVLLLTAHAKVAEEAGKVVGGVAEYLVKLLGYVWYVEMLGAHPGKEAKREEERAIRATTRKSH